MGNERSPSSQGCRTGWQVSAALAGLFAALFIAVLGLGLNPERATYDQDHHYLAAVRQFADQWPRVQLRDYASATTPGYLLALSILCRVLTDSTTGLRVANAATTVALLGLIGFWLGRRLTVGLGILVGLPLVASSYVFVSGAWVLPDNAGWLLLLGVLLLASRFAHRARWYAAAALAMTLLVWVRQSHLWASALIWLAAWLGESRSAGDPRSPPVDSPGRSVRLAWALLATAPAWLSVAWFFWLWQGAAPPRYQGLVQGPNFAVPATVFMVAGFAGVPFTVLVWPRLQEVVRTRLGQAAILTGALLGLAAAVIPVTTFQFPQRATGLWNLARHLPEWEGRSLGVAAASTIGAVVWAWWLAALPSARVRLFHLAAWSGFIAAQSASALAWQRYYEPFVLIMVMLAVGEMIDPRQRVEKWRLVGPVVLTMLLAAATLVSLT